jgi:hypothetical protein
MGPRSATQLRCQRCLSPGGQERGGPGVTLAAHKWYHLVTRCLREAFNQWLGQRYTSDSGLRLGINTVAYALTQEGSLARRYVVSR